MTTTLFGAFHCTSGGTAHYFLDGARRPLCGVLEVAGEPAAGKNKSDGLCWKQPLCETCKRLNTIRWANGGTA